MSQTPLPSRRGVPLAAAVRSLAVIVLLAGCSSLVEARPTPTPLDFGGIQGALAQAGIALTNTVSGDAGCSDPNLIPTAIGFDASGQGVTTPVRLRIYIFTDRAAWQRRQPDVDACIAASATDPTMIETIGQSPYVVAGQGPWPAAFKTALAAALVAAAGNGD
jgi:hypothetical protein